MKPAARAAYQSTGSRSGAQDGPFEAPLPGSIGDAPGRGRDRTAPAGRARQATPARRGRAGRRPWQRHPRRRTCAPQTVTCSPRRRATGIPVRGSIRWCCGECVADPAAAVGAAGRERAPHECDRLPARQRNGDLAREPQGRRPQTRTRHRSSAPARHRPSRAFTTPFRSRRTDAGTTTVAPSSRTDAPTGKVAGGRRRDRQGARSRLS